MLLGKIIGKVTTKEFQFLVKNNSRKFEYIQVMHKDGYYVLGQIIELEKDSEKEIASCNVIGYRENGNLKVLSTPLDPNSEVLKADDDFVKETLGLETEKGVYIGKLNGKDIKTYLDINRVLTKHISVLAKSGSGKSYTVGVLLEEFLDRKVPVLVIDPHGEYSSLKFPNLEEKERLISYTLEPKGYLDNVREFSINIKENPSATPLKLNSKNLSSSELIHLLPAKLSNAQLGVLYSSLKDLGDRIDFNSLILALEQEESSVKWTLLNTVEYVRNLNLFSDMPTRLDELIKPGQISIINLKGVNTEVQEVIVYKIVKDLFYARKLGNIAPFLLVLEEAHNYIPERGYGEAKSSNILRQVFAEGRKFGLGCCLITQRPSRVEKNALSQITTQIILKVTNPNDIKSISSSVEGITLETEKEIQNLPIGTALVTGVVDRPLFVDIRPRKSKHGGIAVKIFEDSEIIEEKDVVNEVNNFNDELLPLIKQKVSLSDMKLIYGKEVKTCLIPCLFLRINYGNEEMNLLLNLHNGELVNNMENGKGIKIELDKFNMSSREKKFLSSALVLKKFRAAELFSKSGMQFSEVYDMVNSLTSKGIFVRDGDSYRISDNLNFLTDLDKFRLYDNIDYSNIKYDNKLEINFSKEKIKESVGDFLDIKEMNECNLVVYYT
ncbi:MAG: ATP-binding protein [Candidatus Nanoarchaeia archaeon]|nr:ATP-binding protein [Candidatus Nanoarchaeia archaeon]